MNSLRRSHLALAVILGVSLVLRLVLAHQGGQLYFNDENRYEAGVQLYRALATGDMAKVREISAVPAHPFFIGCSAVIAAGQHGLAQFTRHGDWTRPEDISQTLWLGAALLSLCSCLNLFLLYRLVRKAGGGDGEAIWAVLLMASANSAFYYSRHFLPYDLALSAALLSAFFGIDRPSARHAILCGLFAGLTYNVYNGYWYLVPILGSVHGLTGRAAPQRLRLSALCAGAIALMMALPVAIGAGLGGSAYWSALRSFGSSVKLGLFAEGWSLPWEYFWHAERMLGVVVAAGVALAFLRTRREGTRVPAWVKATSFSLLGSYALLILFSNGLAMFVVYARTVKPFVPLVCMLGGWAFNLHLAGQRRLTPWVAGGIAIAASFQFWPHFSRVFPRDVEAAVLRHWGNPKRTLSIAGSLYMFSGWPVTRPDLVLVNNRELYPVRFYLGYPAGETLLQFTHPLSYVPFQYECHLPRERALLRSHDISIRLIQLRDPGAVPDDPPMSMLYAPDRDRPTGYDRAPETRP